MQRFARQDWLWLIGSVVVAVALVALIPYYGLVSGHAEHAALPEVAGTTHRVDVTPSGVEMVMTASDPRDQTVIADIRAHMADEAERYASGDYSDAMGMVSAATAAALRLHADAITVTQRETARASIIQLQSNDPGVYAVLVQWAGEMNAAHHDTMANP